MEFLKQQPPPGGFPYEMSLLHERGPSRGNQKILIRSNRILAWPERMLFKHPRALKKNYPYKLLINYKRNMYLHKGETGRCPPTKWSNSAAPKAGPSDTLCSPPEGRQWGNIALPGLCLPHVMFSNAEPGSDHKETTRHEILKDSP